MHGHWIDMSLDTEIPLFIGSVPDNTTHLCPLFIGSDGGCGGIVVSGKRSYSLNIKMHKAQITEPILLQSQSSALTIFYNCLTTKLQYTFSADKTNTCKELHWLPVKLLRNFTGYQYNSAVSTRSQLLLTAILKGLYLLIFLHLVVSDLLMKSC